MRRMRSLTADPDFAALEMFLLPDRDDFLQAIDGEAARLERLRAMRRRNRDCDRSFTDFDHSDAMSYRDASDLPSAAGFLGQFANFRQGHRLVGLVLQSQNLAPDVVLARS